MVLCHGVWFYIEPLDRRFFVVEKGCLDFKNVLYDTEKIPFT